MKTFKEFKELLLAESKNILSPYWDRLEALKPFRGKFNSSEKNAYEHSLDLFNIMIDDYDHIMRNRVFDSFKKQLDNYLKSLENRYIRNF